MPVKHADARNWREVRPSPDGLRWSAWPKGNRPDVSSTFSLQFPRNVDDAGADSTSNTTAPFAALQFNDPASAGLNVYGASNTAGQCWVWKVQYIAQLGYYALHWYSRGDGQFNSPSLLPYHGCHPYPAQGYNNKDYPLHIWECATQGPSGGMDIIDSSGTNWSDGMNSGTPPPVTNGTQINYDQTYVQGLRIIRNSADSVTHVFYPDLPNTSFTIAQTYNLTGIGNQTIPGGNSPKFTIGDSPWYTNFQHERASCYYDAVKLFSSVLTVSDMVSEASDFTSIKTSAGAAAIWWGRNGFDAQHADHNASVLCHYGTGRAFTVLNPSANAFHQIQLAARL